MNTKGSHRALPDPGSEALDRKAILPSGWSLDHRGDALAEERCRQKLVQKGASHQVELRAALEGVASELR
jgi:hypothetical protein